MCVQAEFDRLLKMGVTFDPNKSYKLDPPGAVNTRATYVFGGGGGGGGGASVKTDLEYDRDIHLGLYVGYRMFKSGLGYIHSNGAVSRVSEDTMCACGACH